MVKVKELLPKLPPRLSGAPNSPRQAKRMGVKYWFSRQKGKGRNKGREFLVMHNEYNPEGRAVGVISKKFEKDENEFHMGVRMWNNLPDDAPVVLDGTLKKVQNKRDEPRPTPTDYEPCPGAPAPPRDRAKLAAVLADGLKPPVPAGTKWKQIRKWAGDLIEYYRNERKSYLTAHGLLHQAAKIDWPEEKRSKLIRRLKGIYQADLAAEKAEMAAMATPQPAETEPKTRLKGAPSSSDASKRKKGGKKREGLEGAFNHDSGQSEDSLDSWGHWTSSKLSRVAQCVTREPQTAEVIAFQCDVKGAHKLLEKLRADGYVIRTSQGYKLKKGVEECRA